MIDRYAERFGQDPERVFTDISFDTIAAFSVKWKERDEYDERFSYIWQEIVNPPGK